MEKIVERIKKSKNLGYFLLSIILTLGFVVRLYKINNPVADWHSWRQADTSSVSRIYVDKGIDLLYPRYYDISSIQTGIYNPRGLRMVEFPIFNVLHALLYKSFSFFSLEVWGRLLSIFSSLLTAFFIFLIGKRYFGKFGGVLSAFFFLFIPYNIYFTRVILPEPMATMFIVSSLWFFIKFINDNKKWQLYLSALLFAISLLIKPFTFFYGIFFFYLAVKKFTFKGIFKNIPLLVFLDIALIPFFLWRIWINQYPAGIPFFTWAFNGDSIRFRPAFWRWIFGERLGRLILGIWGLVPFAFGILNTKKTLVHQILLFGMFLYISVFATASVRHDYYQIFAIPAIALTLTAGAVYLWEEKSINKWIARPLLIFSLVMMLGMGVYQIKEFYKVNHPEIIAAGEALDKLAPKDAKVIVPYNGDTAFLYQTKRFGWPAVDDSIENLIKKGASYYVSVDFSDPDTKYVMSKYKVVEKTERYVIVDLKGK